ncbi:MAG TPA: hypothetical protein VF498_04235 [Anaerolineales bacterium]
MSSVLFVCTANICRSPIAMALWREKLGSAAKGWRIESAGTWAMEGERAASRAQTVLLERGIDLSAHRSRSVTREMLRNFTLILTMEHGHKEALRAEFPEFASRIYLLHEMVGDVREVRDPMGGSMIDFQDTANEIDQVLTQGYDRICALAIGQVET